MNSRRSAEFRHSYLRLPEAVRSAAQAAYAKFAANPAHPGLHLERLRSDPRFWSVRLNRNFRAVAYRTGDRWVWIWIGSHEEFDRRFAP